MNIDKDNIPQHEDFYSFGLHPSVLDGLDAMGFQHPSPVQEASIPPILEGRDVISCAQTGTGKTAAFVLPILSELASGEYSEEYVNAVIMAPTRELAQQIDRQIDAFSYFVSGVSAVPIYGGTGGIEWEQQKRALRMGADIIVATPGRLLSHINLNTVDLSRVSFFVLDEADRMLDMGFFDDIVEVYKLLPQDVQTVMFSATMPDKIRKLAIEITKQPVEVNIAISRPPESIDQSVYFCKEDEKLALLTQIFKEREVTKSIVFFGSKDRVKEAYRLLRSNGYKVAQMHSDLDQSERNDVMNDFKNGHTQIIVATDILSRGIDVDDIQLIVNYDVPSDPEDYVHRIGRTSRGTNLGGAAITIVNQRDKGRFIDIEKFLGYNVQRNNLPEGFVVLSEEHEQPSEKSRNKRRGRNNNRNRKGASQDSPQNNKRRRRNGANNNKVQSRGAKPTQKPTAKS
ncbi:DEAD/DEAH box helicase [uncultured Porphyromonas sp.]|uniref:DEAD/DEAH box helicase n=1 Tax=uncultured Porphyromonas sp. TaxID=159274 RepID=UPI0026322D56|nr:DEAD/DEAH box helicase [uncultured Porphyromonas sp.]